MLWYILHVVMESTAAMNNGFIFLANARFSRLHSFDPKWASQVSSMLDRSFPIQWKMVHVCHAMEVFPLVSQAIRAILTKTQRQSFLMHNGSDERVLETLFEQSLQKHCVPTDLGEWQSVLSS